MLTELRVDNFKCFGRLTTIPFRRLSLLTGVNSKGKSSATQPILCLHQSLVETSTLERLELNGRYVHLGTYGEVRNRDTPLSEPMIMEFVTGHVQPSGGTACRLVLRQEEPTERWARIAEVSVETFTGTEVSSEPRVRTAQPPSSVNLDFRWSAAEPEPLDSFADASGLSAFERVHYISADRLGPRDFFLRPDSTGFVSVGVRGEGTAEVLFRSMQAQLTVAEELVLSAPTVTVIDQVSAWLAYVFEGGAVRVSAPLSPILTIEMNSDGSAHYVRPVNLGFGYSYVLPIVVAALTAESGDILIVENPEAHLHPMAQSRVGELLARVSARGVQVVVESHSEHMLSAFRLAVRDKVIEPEDLCVLYFGAGPDPVLRIPVDDAASIKDWPEKFFDQRTKDIVRLYG